MRVGYLWRDKWTALSCHAISGPLSVGFLRRQRWQTRAVEWLARFRAKREQLERFQGLLAESQGQNQVRSTAVREMMRVYVSTRKPSGRTRSERCWSRGWTGAGVRRAFLQNLLHRNLLHFPANEIYYNFLQTNFTTQMLYYC